MHEFKQGANMSTAMQIDSITFIKLFYHLVKCFVIITFTYVVHNDIKQLISYDSKTFVISWNVYEK